jgi:hypothetical protein
MTFVLDIAIVVISLVFLGIVGLIAGVAIPGLFMSAAAPWLDWILPARNGHQNDKNKAGATTHS